MKRIRKLSLLIFLFFCSGCLSNLEEVSDGSTDSPPTDDSSSDPGSIEPDTTADTGSGSSETDSTVLSLIDLSPTESTIETGSEIAFIASGGTGSFTFSIISGISGNSSIDTSTGLYTAGDSAGIDVIRVVDSAGQIADAVITVANELIIDPSETSLGLYQTLDLSAEGGLPPLVFSVDGPAEIDSETGWLSTADTEGTAAVTITDARGITATAIIEISADGLTTRPSPASVLLNESVTLTASGGSGSSLFTLISGDGVIDENTGEFLAGSEPGTAIARVTDSLGNIVDVAIAIEADELVLSPSAVSVSAGSTTTFSVSGGIPPLNLEVIDGDGTIDEDTGVFTPGGSTDTATIQVTDAAQQTAQTSVTIIKPVELRSGQWHVCARFNTGAIKCWGRGNYGQLGTGATASLGDGVGEMGSSLAEVNLGTGLEAIALDSGYHHNCVLLSDETIKCWGRGNYGQLGTGATASLGDGASEMGDSLQVIDLGTGRTATAIVTGAYHNCAILDDTSVKCWGRNVYGQLGLEDTADRGDGSAEMGDSLTSVNLGTGRTASALAAGGFHTCAILDDSTLKCWGRNNQGQLGLGSTANKGDGTGEMGDSLLAVNLGTGRTALAVAAGLNHTCVLLDNSDVKCFGDGAYGQLGSGLTSDYGKTSATTGDSLPALSLGSSSVATGISVGDNFSCALLSNGSLKCWGQNSYGQLGLGDTSTRGDATGEMGDDLASIDLGTSLSPLFIEGGATQTCAITSTYRAKCWGRNNYGQLGLGDTTDRGDTADEMGDYLDFVVF